MISRYKKIVSATRDAIVCADNTGKITYVNPAAERLFGYRSHELVGNELTILMPAGFKHAHQAGLKRFALTGRTNEIGRTVELVGLNKNGTEFPLELSLSAYKTSDQFEAIGIIRDITARKKLLAKLEERATTDYLTGLFNRQIFDLKLLEECKRAGRYKTPLALLLADLDHFKKYNDLYGHQAGDTVLKTVAAVFRQSVRTTDLVARYGGEEIAAILPETEIADAASLAERIRLAVRNLGIDNRGPASPGPLTISIGVAGFSRAGDYSDLIEKADIALYRAKSAGRDRVITWSEDLADTVNPPAKGSTGNKVVR